MIRGTGFVVTIHWNLILLSASVASTKHVHFFFVFISSVADCTMQKYFVFICNRTYANNEYAKNTNAKAREKSKRFDSALACVCALCRL